MRLIVIISERWVDASCPVAWALVGHDGTLAQKGSSLIADLPQGQRTILVIAASRVLLASANLPRHGTGKIRKALAYAVEDQLTSDPDSVHAVAAGARRGSRQAIAVIERKLLRALVASFQSVGVTPDSVTVETSLTPLAEGEWTVVLREGGGFLRTGEAAGMALDSPLDGCVPGVLRLALEAARKAGDAPRKIVIRSDFSLDGSSWESELGVPCEGAGPWHAWQSVERPSVEFLQGEFAHRRALSARWAPLRPAAILTGAALAIEVIGTFVHWGALRYEKAQLEARMHDQFKGVFPQAQAVVDPALQMRRNLQAARSAAGVAQESDFLPLLAKAVRANTSAGWKVKTVSYDGGRLTLDVVLADSGQVDSMLKHFADKDISVALEAAASKGSTRDARLVFATRGLK